MFGAYEQSNCHAQELVGSQVPELIKEREKEKRWVKCYSCAKLTVEVGEERRDG